MTAAALLLGAAVAAWLVRLEAKRPDRRRLGWRVAATIVSVAMLVLMWLEPAVPRTARASRAILVTPGASAAGMRSLADSFGAARIVSLDSVRDLASLRRASPGIGELRIAGWGLPKEELERSGDLRLSFSPAPLPDGLREIDWPARIALGEAVSIRGRSGQSGTWLHLTGPGIESDSARSDSAGRFEVGFVPKAAGLQRFTLSGDGTTDTGAVDVRDLPEPNLLLLLGRPDFESSHLRRRVAARGGAVASRVTLSRGRIRREALNGAPLPGAIVDSALLAWADVVWIDGAAQGALTPGERRALSSAVTGEGLGVITDAGTAAALGLAPPVVRGERAREVRIRSPGEANLLPPVATEPVALEESAAAEVLLEESSGRPVAVALGAGAGRVALSSVRNPSRWLLAGEDAAFDRYWATLVSAVRRPRLEWRTASPLIARADRPVGFTWPGMLERAVVIGNGMRDTVSLTMTADSLAATGRFWPRAAGSYTLAGGADTLRFLVTGEASWPGPEAATRVERTRLHAALHSAGGDAGRPVRVPEPVPSWLFWAFFVPAASWLWWERRRAAGKGGENGRHVTPVLRRDL